MSQTYLNFLRLPGTEEGPWSHRGTCGIQGVLVAHWRVRSFDGNTCSICMPPLQQPWALSRTISELLRLNFYVFFLLSFSLFSAGGGYVRAGGILNDVCLRLTLFPPLLPPKHDTTWRQFLVSGAWCTHAETLQTHRGPVLCLCNERSLSRF